MKKIKSQFLFDLGKIYDVEHRIAKALPQMVKPDTSEDLKLAILTHAKQSEQYVTKVEQIFECFGETAGGYVKSAIAEGEGTSDKIDSSLAEAAALISALKMVEQGGLPPQGLQREWEIASYGCLHEWASLLGSAESADLLEQILEEDRAARRDGPDDDRVM
jgi:ferritin-like metal-binding protein YciE